MMLSSVAVSRARSPTAAVVSPIPVQAKAETRIVTRIAGNRSRRDRDADDQPADDEGECRDEEPVRDHRHRPAEEEGIRLAGVASTAPSVFWYRSPAIVFVIAKTQGIAAYWSAFPIT